MSKQTYTYEKRPTNRLFFHGASVRGSCSHLTNVCHVAVKRNMSEEAPMYEKRQTKRLTQRHTCCLFFQGASVRRSCSQLTDVCDVERVKRDPYIRKETNAPPLTCSKLHTSVKKRPIHEKRDQHTVFDIHIYIYSDVERGKTYTENYNETPTYGGDQI